MREWMSGGPRAWSTIAIVRDEKRPIARAADEVTVVVAGLRLVVSTAKPGSSPSRRQPTSPRMLPIARSPELAKAMAYAHEELGNDPSIEAAARRAGLSVRTLSRRFAEEAQTTWREYLHLARMIRAMELLSANARVTETAFAIGFQSPAAFGRAFQRLTGLRPSFYRLHGQRGRSRG